MQRACWRRDLYISMGSLFALIFPFERFGSAGRVGALQVYTCKSAKSLQIANALVQNYYTVYMFSCQSPVTGKIPIAVTRTRVSLVHFVVVFQVSFININFRKYKTNYSLDTYYSSQI